MLKTWVCAAFVWMGLGSVAFAQDTPSPERLALARDVMMASGGEQLFNDMFEQMRPLMAQDMRSRGVSTELAQRIITMTADEYRREAPRFVELGAIAYAGKFSEQELRDIAAFYRSPAGRALIENQAEIAGAMMQAGVIIGQEIALRIQERLRTTPAPNTP